MIAHFTRTVTSNPKRREGRRRATGLGGAALVVFLAAAAFLGEATVVRATSNFCGATWNDASSNCDDRKPCPLGTDEECTYGGSCWGDTTCDTALGHGKLYDLEHPEHSRFCGVSWNDANENCKLSRHCPSGDSSECLGDEDCYSFLSDCNYVEMMGGPGAAAASISGGGEGNSGRLPSDDPSRNNYCGWDWNDALAGCSKDDHWCPSGSDSDCPGGKVCFAGTECKYVSDLSPTLTPTNRPTYPPTLRPVVYNTVENTRFCGDGWEDARTTCRIASHCPSGSNSDCYGSQVCFSWITGCNIVDFEEHLRETGKEIFGVDHWLLPEGEGSAWSNGSGAEEDNASAVNPPGPSLPSTANVPQLPPAKIKIPTSPLTPKPPTQSPTTALPTIYDRYRYRAENHIFCGTSWNDAMERCSPETFCVNGAATRCEGEKDFCWVGVSACNAAEWVPTWVPSPSPATARPTPSPTPKPGPIPTPKPIQTNNPISRPMSSPQSATSQVLETIATTIRQSYCAIDYNHLKQHCATLSTCNRYKPCPDDYMCFANYKCTMMVASGPAPKSASVKTSSPFTLAPISDAPISNAPITNSPISNAPVTGSPTQHPTILTLSDYEVAQRLTNMNNYCATSLSQVMSSCSYTLYTCNASDRMCRPGTFCFENIVCPDAEAATRAPVTAGPTPPPTPKPISNSMNNFGNGNESTISTATVAQNYCAQSELQLRCTCSKAPTCNDEDGPCPSGTFCFGNYVCNNDSSAMSTTLGAEAGTTSAPTTTPKLTQKPISLLEVSNVLSKKPPLSVNNGYTYSDTVAVMMQPQNYCAKSQHDLPSSCEEAQTCNDGDGPCPSGSFCFGNYLCRANESAGSSLATSTPRTATPTSKPTSVSLNQPAAMSGENAAAATTANYCAHTAQQLESTCAWAPTCNDGDGPCPKDKFCFRKIVCKSGPQQAMDEAATRLPTAMPSPEKNHDATDTPAFSDQGCGDLCLLPIGNSDCEYILSIEMDILPCATAGAPVSGGVHVGDMCTGTERCGAEFELNNCRSIYNDRGVYVRLESSKCVEHGLVSGSGVISLSVILDNKDSGTVNSEGTGVHHDLPNIISTNEFEDNQTASKEASSNSPSSTGENQGEVEWEDRAPDYEISGHDTFHDNGDQDRDDFTGWWLMENNLNSATGTLIGRKQKHPTASKALVPMIAFYLLR